MRKNILICGALRDLVPFVQFKKRENTHGGALLYSLSVAQIVSNRAKHQIWRKIIKLKGEGRGRYIAASSVHNQRIIFFKPPKVKVS